MRKPHNYCGYFKWEMIISVIINCYSDQSTNSPLTPHLWLGFVSINKSTLSWIEMTRNDNRCVCLGLQNPPGHCHCLCKVLRGNGVLWPGAFSSTAGQELPACLHRYKWILLAASPTQPCKKRTAQTFLGPWSHAKAAQTGMSQVCY